MNPDVLVQFIDRYGLPLAIVIGLGWALWRRILILGSEKERSDTAYQRELDYREARRLEERQGRLQAEGALRKMVDAVNKVSDNLDSLTDAVSGALEEAQRDKS